MTQDSQNFRNVNCSSVREQVFMPTLFCTGLQPWNCRTRSEVQSASSSFPGLANMGCFRERWMKLYPHHFEKIHILNINVNPEAQSYVLFKTVLRINSWKQGWSYLAYKCIISTGSQKIWLWELRGATSHPFHPPGGSAKSCAIPHRCLEVPGNKVSKDV